MRSASYIRWGGLAAVLGGIIWITKGSLIILGIIDLGDLFIAAELFFAVALVGLYLHMRDRGERLGRIGGVLAYLALALASLAIIIGLVLLGIVTLRAGILPTRWRMLPLAIGLLALLPVWVLAFVHVELPVVVLGIGWVLLGYALWSEADTTTRRRPQTS